jgi:predicted nucleic acid-binding protein
MSAFADTSFLFAFHFRQRNSERAVEWLAAGTEPPLVSALVVFEFTQAVRFEVFLQTKDHTKGCSEIEGLGVLAQFESHLEQGTFQVLEPDVAGVLREASRLSAKHTIREGYRAFDILHVAAALSLGARDFLTFDEGQRSLAEAEGLHVPL